MHSWCWTEAAGRPSSEGHSQNREAGVYKQHLAGDLLRSAGGQEERRVRHVGALDAGAQRHRLRVPLQHLVEIWHGLSGQGADGARGDGVDPDAS